MNIDEKDPIATISDPTESPHFPVIDTVDKKSPSKPEDSTAALQDPSNKHRAPSFSYSGGLKDSLDFNSQSFEGSIAEDQGRIYPAQISNLMSIYLFRA